MGGGYAGVGGEFVEVIEAGARGPRGKSGFALLGEVFLKAGEDGAGEWIARRNGTTRAWIAALELNFTDREADDAAFVFAEETILPEGWECFGSGGTIDFERGAKAHAGFFESNSREVLVA